MVSTTKAGTMATATVRISESTRAALRELAIQADEPMSRVLEKAIAHYRESLYWDRVDAAYAALKADPVAWAEELDERAVWDVTLQDGLEDDPAWPES